MKKVSIIVPIYNMENFIESGINCLLQQTYTETEIILVDDGSKDNSLNKLNEMAKTDARIRVFTKPNEGAGPTRNFGIEQATGEYAYFFDIDDDLYPDCIEKLVGAIEEKSADLVVCGFEMYDDNGVFKTVKKAGGLFRTGAEARNDYYKHCFMYKEYGIQGAAWYKLYKMSIINRHHITFPDLRRSQDEIFVARYVTYIGSVYFIDDVLCRYYANDNRRMFDKYPLDYFDIAKRSTDYLLNTIYTWNKSNTEVRNKIYSDYYQKTFISLWILFNKKWKLSYAEKMEKIKDITDVFAKDFPQDKCGINTDVLDYLLTKNYRKLYLRMKYYSFKHKKD